MTRWQGWLLRVLAPAGLAALVGTPVAAGPDAVRTLPNGLRVAVFSDHRLPIVQIQLLVPAGSRQELPLESGAAQVAARMLSLGTSSRTADQFARDVERLGGAFAGDATRDFASVSGTFRSADLERGMELMADAVTHPIFDVGAFREVQRDLLRSVLQSRGRLDVVADEHAWALAMGEHPYARPEHGTLEGLASLTRDQVLAFHSACYRPDHALLAVAGDVDAERALKVIQDNFGSWAGESRPEAPIAEPVAPAGLHIRLVDAPGAKQAEVRVAVLTPSHRSEDAYALTVLNDLLGGGPASRLGDGGKVLRYYSRLQLLERAGLLILSTAVRNDSVMAGLGRLRGELARLASDPPSQADVERSRRTIARAFPIQNESLGARAAQWLSGALLNEPDNYADSYPARIMAVTADRVRDVAGRVCTPDRAEIVVVGDASALRSQLETLGSVEELTLRDPAVKVAVSAAMRTDEPDSTAVARARQLVKQAAAAHGGLTRLKAVKDSRVEADVTIYRGPQSITGRQTEVRREPLQLRVETAFKQLSTVQALHGDSAWARVTTPAADSTIDEGPDGVSGLQHQFAGDFLHVLLTATDPASRVALRGQEEVRGSNTDVVEVVDSHQQRIVLFLGDKNHQLVAVEENEGSALRGPALRRVFGDYRAVQGILWPHFEERLLNGERTVTLAVRSVRTNVGIAPALFRKPEDLTPSHPRR